MLLPWNWKRRHGQ